MHLGFTFFFTNIMLGVGLAMDAFSVSLANGLNEPNMKKSKLFTVAGVFAGFQAAMPLIGWFCVTTLLELFSAFEPFIPWIALILLCFIGGKMLIEGIRGDCGESDTCGVGWAALLVQGVATSIDALSVGFTIADYPAPAACVEALIIGVVTFGICMIGLRLGKRFVTRLAGKASILGGVILIAIGIEIFLKGILS
jgi:putative Mn2+ efflux pump MntP